MSKMSDLVVDIENMLFEHVEIESIAAVLDIPVEWVEAVAVTYEGEDVVESDF